jgi:hypothetical protein
MLPDICWFFSCPEISLLKRVSLLKEKNHVGGDEILIRYAKKFHFTYTLFS